MRGLEDSDRFVALGDPLAIWVEVVGDNRAHPLPHLLILSAAGSDSYRSCDRVAAHPSRLSIAKNPQATFEIRIMDGVVIAMGGLGLPSATLRDEGRWRAVHSGPRASRRQ